jgi:hypothetical protein
VAGAGLEEDGVVGRLFGDLAYRGARLEEELAEAGVLLAAERADRRPAIRQESGASVAWLRRDLQAATEAVEPFLNKGFENCERANRPSGIGASIEATGRERPHVGA